MLHYDFIKKKLIFTDSKMLSFLHEIYREQRYLMNISDEMLSERLEHLIINLIELDFYGGKSLIIKQGKMASALIDVFEEFNLRNIDYSPLIETVLSRFEKHAKFMNCSSILKQLKDCAGEKCLFKYTYKKYLDLLRKGDVRLKLASSYNDDGFNVAIRDDEINIIHQLLNARIITEDGSEIPIKDDIIIRSAFSDYYVGCFSVTIDPKIFLTSDYDACLIIKNADIFAQEVIDRYQDNYNNSTILFGPVEYIDPYIYLKSKNKIEFVKTIYYKYETEFRFVAFDRIWINKEEERKINIDMKKIDYDIIEK